MSIVAVGFALLVCHGAVAADQPQPVLVLEETEGTHHGIWELYGLQGTADWGGQKASLTLRQPFDGKCIAIHRVDTSGTSVGLTADYSGCADSNGDIAKGDVTWEWASLRPPVSQGNFTAHILSAAEAYQRGMKAFLTPNKAVARHWFELSVAQGNASAGLALAVMLRDGIGGPKDFDAARKLFERAAVAGDAGAKYALGRMEELGLGKPADFPAARKWYELAAASHYELAKKQLAFLDGLDYAPSLADPAPAWHRDNKTLRDNTVVHILFTHQPAGNMTLVVAVECWTQGISSAGTIGMGVWLLSDIYHSPPITELKYRRRDVDIDAKLPPAEGHYFPNRWELFKDLPGDIEANRARLGPQQMLALYQQIFQGRPPGSGPDYRDILELELHHTTPGQASDSGDTQTIVTEIDMTGLDDSRHDFLVDACRMADPFAEPSVRRGDPDRD